MESDGMNKKENQTKCEVTRSVGTESNVILKEYREKRDGTTIITILCRAESWTKIFYALIKQNLETASSNKALNVAMAKGNKGKIENAKEPNEFSYRISNDI